MRNDVLGPTPTRDVAEEEMGARQPLIFLTNSSLHQEGLSCFSCSKKGTSGEEGAAESRSWKGARGKHLQPQGFFCTRSAPLYHTATFPIPRNPTAPLKQVAPPRPFLSSERTESWIKCKLKNTHRDTTPLVSQSLWRTR